MRFAVSVVFVTPEKFQRIVRARRVLLGLYRGCGIVATGNFTGEK
jgi:hypothetical protein